MCLQGLHPEVSAAQDDCDWFKELQTRERCLLLYCVSAVEKRLTMQA